MAWAGVRTIKLKLVDREPPIRALPSVPVRVSPYVPGGAPAVLIVKVEEKPPAFPLAGVKVGVAPGGKPDNDSPIEGSPDVEEPGTKVSVTPYALVPVVRIWRLVGFPATV